MRKVMAMSGRTVSLKAGSESDLVALGRSIRAARDRREFPEFCATIPIHTRKAYDLIAIADAVDADRLTLADVTDIGWSKACLIAAQATGKAATRKAIRVARSNTLPAVFSVP